MTFSARLLIPLSLAACTKSGNDQVGFDLVAAGSFEPGPVSGQVRRGEALPTRFASERVDLKQRRQLELNSGDFDGDGDADLASLPYASIPRISWNDGTGKFATSLTLTDLGEVDVLNVADFNGDGAMDLEAHDVLESLQVILNEGGKGFSSPFAIDSKGDLIYECLVAAWDAKPGDELIWSIDNPDSLYVASWSPDGWQVSALCQPWDWNHTSLSLAAADINNDGRADLVLLHTNTVYLQQADGTLSETPLVAESIHIEAAADFDEDGRCDLLVSERGEGLSILSMGEGEAWMERGSFPSHGADRMTLFVDLDGNGFKDLCIQQSGFYSMGCFGAQEGWMSQSNWQVLLRDADGWLLRESQPVNDYVNYPGLIARFDQDSYPDLIVQDEEGIGVSLVRDPFRP